MPAPPVRLSEKLVEQLLELLESGKSLSEICRVPGMPARGTIHRWANADDDLGARIRESREIGYHSELDQMVEDVSKATDASMARNIFESRRYRLSKLSNAFADKPVAAVQVNVGGSAADDAFAAFAAALNHASGTIAGRSESTRQLGCESTPRPADPEG